MSKCRVVVRGKGIDIARAIGKLGKEFHIPGGYKFCGPGTKTERILNSETPKNKLDEACFFHDSHYLENPHNLGKRHEADKILENKAWQRVVSKDARLGERLSALGVGAIMNLKRKFGAGIGNNKAAAAATTVSAKRKKTIKKRKNKTSKNCRKKDGTTNRARVFKFERLINVAKKAIPKKSSLSNKIKRAIMVTKAFLKNSVMNEEGKKLIPPRIIPIPPHKTGGFLPALIPILTALGSVGGLASTVSSIVSTINNIKNAKKQLEEEKRHNLALEGKMVGSGLYLRTHKKGFGIYLNPFEQARKN